MPPPIDPAYVAQETDLPMTTEPDTRARVLRLCEHFAACLDALTAHRETGTSTANTEVALAGHIQALAELGAALPKAPR